MKEPITLWFELDKFVEDLITKGIGALVQDPEYDSKSLLMYSYDGPIKKDAELICELVRKHNEGARDGVETN